MDTASFLDQLYAGLPSEILARAKKIRLLSLDIDGVMTAGNLLFGFEGERSKVGTAVRSVAPGLVCRETATAPVIRLAFFKFHFCRPLCGNNRIGHFECLSSEIRCAIKLRLCNLPVQRQ